MSMQQYYEMVSDFALLKGISNDKAAVIILEVCILFDNMMKSNFGKDNQ